MSGLGSFFAHSQSHLSYAYEYSPQVTTVEKISFLYAWKHSSLYIFYFAGSLECRVLRPWQSRNTLSYQALLSVKISKQFAEPLVWYLHLDQRLYRQNWWAFTTDKEGGSKAVNLIVRIILSVIHRYGSIGGLNVVAQIIILYAVTENIF